MCNARDFSGQEMAAQMSEYGSQMDELAAILKFKFHSAVAQCIPLKRIMKKNKNITAAADTVRQCRNKSYRDCNRIKLELAIQYYRY